MQNNFRVHVPKESEWACGTSVPISCDVLRSILLETVNTPRNSCRDELLMHMGTVERISSKFAIFSVNIASRGDSSANYGVNKSHWREKV